MVNDFSIDNSTESHDNNQASDHDELDDYNWEGRREIVQVGANLELGAGEHDETDVVSESPNPIDMANEVVEAVGMDVTVAESSINNGIGGGLSDSDDLVDKSDVTNEHAGMDVIVTEHDEHDNVLNFFVSHLVFLLTREIFRDHKNKYNIRILLQSQQQLIRVELT